MAARTAPLPKPPLPRTPDAHAALPGFCAPIASSHCAPAAALQALCAPGAYIQHRVTLAGSRPSGLSSFFVSLVLSPVLPCSRFNTAFLYCYLRISSSGLYTARGRHCLLTTKRFQHTCPPHPLTAPLTTACAGNKAPTPNVLPRKTTKRLRLTAYPRNTERRKGFLTRRRLATTPKANAATYGRITPFWRAFKHRPATVARHDWPHRGRFMPSLANSSSLATLCWHSRCLPCLRALQCSC